MKTKTHFAFRVDIWDDTGNSIVEHVAGVDDFEVAEATYRAAVAHWPADHPAAGRAGRARERSAAMRAPPGPRSRWRSGQEIEEPPVRVDRPHAKERI